MHTKIYVKVGSNLVLPVYLTCKRRMEERHIQYTEWYNKRRNEQGEC